jgi:hypothetical protein
MCWTVQFNTGKYDGGICQKGRALSSGAIVGIAVACVVAVVAIAAAIFLFLRKKKMDKMVRFSHHIPARLGDGVTLLLRLGFAPPPPQNLG